MAFTVEQDKIQLLIFPWDLMQNSETYSLWVPDGCIIYLTAVKRLLELSLTAYRNQLKYSFRNKRPAELIGLTSIQVENFDQFEFIQFANQLPKLQLQSYSETKAEFASSSSDVPYVILHNSSLLLRYIQQDGLRLLFRKERGCVMMTTDSDVSILELNDVVLEIRIDAILSENVRTRKLLTPPTCQFHLIQIQRTLDFETNSFLGKLLKYAVPLNRMSEVHLNVESNQVRSPWNYITYLESFKDIQPLVISRGSRGWTEYQRQPSMIFEFIPANFDFLLSIATEKQSVISLTLTITKPRCDIDVYRIVPKSGERIRISSSRLISMKRTRFSRKTLYLSYKPYLLALEFGREAKFVLRSACDLGLQKAQFKIQSTRRANLIRLP